MGITLVTLLKLTFMSFQKVAAIILMGATSSVSDISVNPSSFRIFKKYSCSMVFLFLHLLFHSIDTDVLHSHNDAQSSSKPNGWRFQKRDLFNKLSIYRVSFCLRNKMFIPFIPWEQNNQWKVFYWDYRFRLSDYGFLLVDCSFVYRAFTASLSF